MPVAQSGLDAPGRIILGTTQGCPLSQGARWFAHSEPIGVTLLIRELQGKLHGKCHNVSADRFSACATIALLNEAS